MQNVLLIFIGLFLFVVVGLIVFVIGFYGECGWMVLFCFIIGIIGLIVILLLCWIDYLICLGCVGEMMGCVEDVVCNVIKVCIVELFLGCLLLWGDLLYYYEVVFEQVGYLQYIDMVVLQGFVEDQDIQILVLVLSGSFIYDGMVLVWLLCGVKDVDKICVCFIIGDECSFDQDLCFGMVVMIEIVLCVLFLVINDLGIVLDVIGWFMWLLMIWVKCDQYQFKLCYFCIFVMLLWDVDMLEDVFMLIVCDGVGLIEVQLCL